MKACLGNLFFSSTQIELIDRVDDIYRNTSWDDGTFNGYGIQIEQVLTGLCRGLPCSKLKEHGLNSTVSDYFVWVRAKIIKSYIITSSQDHSEIESCQC